MRAIWEGAINFGLVNIPVKMYSASNHRAGISFDMLRKTDNSPIAYKKVAKIDGKEVEYADIVKGYQAEKGKYVVLSKEDFESANAHKTRNITLRQFVDLADIPAQYFETPYYLEPNNHAEDTYSLLCESLKQSKKVALCTYVLHGHESMAAIVPSGNILVLNQMRFPTELRPATGLQVIEFGGQKAELELAGELIKKLSKPFIPEDWHDTFTEELQDIIAKKSKGKVAHSKPKPIKNTSAGDIAKELKASLGK